ncbi:MAG: hypothetical protein E7644_00885 [Ruminococcaceae bacterium]|nr:hypothetical protein [Oscillospiraceae bacterium]
MKPFFTKITVAVLLLALMLPTLSSCAIKNLFFSFRSPEDKAAHIFSMDINSHEFVDSYRLLTETTIHGKSDGRRWQQSVAEETTAAGLSSTGALTYQRRTATTHTYANSFLGSTTTVQENGFADGKMYSNQIAANGETVSIFSLLTTAEYRTHLAGQGYGLLFRILQETADTVTCEKNDLGEWTVTMTDFSSSGLDRLAIYFGTSRANFADTVQNATFTYRVTEDFVPVEMSFDTTFARTVNEIVSKLTYTARYEDINSTTAAAPDFSAYKEVKDLRLAEEAAAIFREVECSNGISFDKSEKYYLKPDTESGKKVLQESYDYEIRQLESEGDYAFEGSIVDRDGAKMGYKYEGGKLTVEEKDSPNPAKAISSAAARDKVYAWFDTTFFNHCNLTTSEEVNRASRFKFKSVDINSFADRLEAVGSGVNRVRRTSSMLDVEIKDGKLVSYSYMASIWIYRGGSAYVYYYEVTVDNITYS